MWKRMENNSRKQLLLGPSIDELMEVISILKEKMLNIFIFRIVLIYEIIIIKLG
jgi:hypothetical protein